MPSPESSSNWSIKELGRLNAALLSAIAECSARVAISLLIDSKLRLVKLAPLIAGKVPVNLAASIPVAKCSLSIPPAARCSLLITSSAILLPSIPSACI